MRPSPGPAPKAAGRFRSSLEQWRGTKPTFDIVDGKSGEVIFAAGQKISPRAANKALKDGLDRTADPDRGNLWPLCGQAI
jgi:hypothetical protein